VRDVELLAQLLSPLWLLRELLRLSRSIASTDREEQVEIDHVYALHFQGEWVPLSETPHYRYFRSLAEDSPQSSEYLLYMKAQYGWSRLHLAERLYRTRRIYRRVESGHTLDCPTVRESSVAGAYEVIDGFHRATAVAAQLSAETIQVRVISNAKRGD